MNYVIAAWLSCGAILLAYAARTLHRERSLRRSLAPRPAPKRAGAGAPSGAATDALSVTPAGRWRQRSGRNGPEGPHRAGHR